MKRFLYFIIIGLIIFPLQYPFIFSKNAEATSPIEKRDALNKDFQDKAKNEYQERYNKMSKEEQKAYRDKIEALSSKADLKKALPDFYKTHIQPKEDEFRSPFNTTYCYNKCTQCGAQISDQGTPLTTAGACIAACLDSNRQKAQAMGALCLKSIKEHVLPPKETPTPPPAVTPPAPPPPPPPPPAPSEEPKTPSLPKPIVPTPTPTPTPPPVPAPTPSPVPTPVAIPVPPPAVIPPLIIPPKEEDNLVCPLPPGPIANNYPLVKSFVENNAGPYIPVPYVRIKEENEDADSKISKKKNDKSLPTKIDEKKEKAKEDKGDSAPQIAPVAEKPKEEAGKGKSSNNGLLEGIIGAATQVISGNVAGAGQAFTQAQKEAKEKEVSQKPAQSENNTLPAPQPFASASVPPPSSEKTQPRLQPQTQPVSQKISPQANRDMPLNNSSPQNRYNGVDQIPSEPNLGPNQPERYTKPPQSTSKVFKASSSSPYPAQTAQSAYGYESSPYEEEYYPENRELLPSSFPQNAFSSSAPRPISKGKKEDYPASRPLESYNPRANQDKGYQKAEYDDQSASYDPKHGQSQEYKYAESNQEKYYEPAYGQSQRYKDTGNQQDNDSNPQYDYEAEYENPAPRYNQSKPYEKSADKSDENAQYPQQGRYEKDSPIKGPQPSLYKDEFNYPPAKNPSKNSPYSLPENEKYPQPPYYDYPQYAEERPQVPPPVDHAPYDNRIPYSPPYQPYPNPAGKGANLGYPPYQPPYPEYPNPLPPSYPPNNQTPSPLPPSNPPPPSGDKKESFLDGGFLNKSVGETLKGLFNR